MNRMTWQAIQRFRQQMNPADFPENEDIFKDVRDRHPTPTLTLESLMNAIKLEQLPTMAKSLSAFPKLIVNNGMIKRYV